MSVSYIAIIISIIAIIISAITYWNDTLKSFKLTVFDAGRVELTINPYKAPNREPALMVELIFFNEGARSGVVQDVALKVEFPNGEDILFRSMVIATDRTLQFGKELESPKLESFVGFTIPGQNSVFRKIMFVLDKPNNFKDFPLGRYNTEIFAISSSSQEWQSHGSFGFLIEESDLKQLAKNVFTLQPDGRYFLKWYTQSKATEERRKSLTALRQ